MTAAAEETPCSLREDAIRIWKAGVAAVSADRLVEEAVSEEWDGLTFCGEHWSGRGGGRICVVGGGKAGTGMALGLERALGEHWLPRTSGWLNVPADCIRPTRTVHLHPARPAGVNEPTAEGQVGAERILEMVAQLGSEDLCLVLLSGGGSALLPAPREGITLADKQAVTRFLMRSGATITELNAVRRQLSRIKGGGLLRACRAGKLVALIISDVIGDPLDVIASGPTVPSAGTAQDALDVLHTFDPAEKYTPPSVKALLQSQANAKAARADRKGNGAGNVDTASAVPGDCAVSNHVIGNNRTAVDAAADEAIRMGYEVVETETDRAGVARDLGRELAQWALSKREFGEKSRTICRISGGEPTVTLRELDGIHEQKGGRNQELVLAAADALWHESAENIVILSGGTDGEDGPTDAAGAFLDGEILANAKRMGLSPRQYLDWNNSYPFFAESGGHLKTGPTFTNVMDLRIVLVEGQRH